MNVSYSKIKNELSIYFFTFAFACGSAILFFGIFRITLLISSCKNLVIHRLVTKLKLIQNRVTPT